MNSDFYSSLSSGVYIGSQSKSHLDSALDQPRSIDLGIHRGSVCVGGEGCPWFNFLSTATYH